MDEDVRILDPTEIDLRLMQQKAREGKPSRASLPPDDPEFALKYQICNVCNIAKPAKSFGRVSKNRRRATCNRCTRGKQEASAVGLPLEEYLAFSDGPCMFCSSVDTSAFKIQGKPVLRLCAYHKNILRLLEYIEVISLIDTAIKEFPFLVKYIKDSDSRFFVLDSIVPSN